MNYKTAYVEAMNRVHPNYEVTVNGPNKKGFHSIRLNGDAGDMRLTEREIRDATLMLNSNAPLSLRNAKMDPNPMQLGYKAKHNL